MKTDIEFITSILPSSYTVKETDGGVNCFSREGIKYNKDADDDEHWSYIVKALKQHFGVRFKEIFHQVCSNHQQFTVYLTSGQAIDSTMNK